MKVLGGREIGPKKWGAICNYDTRRYSHTYGRCVPWGAGNYRPQVRVVHWGGSQPYNVADREDAIRVMQGIDRYHVWNRKWSAAAYNRGFGGGVMLRVRGEHRNGAHKNSNVHGPITDACLFLIAHESEGLPALRDRRNFAIWNLSKPLPIVGHGDYPEQATKCPGPALSEWISRSGWVEDFGWWQQGDRGNAVRAIRHRLNDLGYRIMFKNRRRYRKGLAGKVRAYQADQGLTVDGIVGPETYRALTNLPS